MDGAPPPEEDFSALPIPERLAHKNWKARVSGYEALVKTFQATPSENDPAFKPYISNPETLKKIVTDANAVAQEKGVETVIAFVKFAGEKATRTREAVVPALVDKCLGSTRQGTKTKALELILEYVEVENGAAAVVVRRDSHSFIVVYAVLGGYSSRSQRKAAKDGGWMCHRSQGHRPVRIPALYAVLATDTHLLDYMVQ